MKRILSIAGGGMKGMPAAAAMMELRRMAGGNLASKVDLMAGTSIGGILASLAACDVPGDWTDFFTKDGPVIFKKNWLRFWPQYPAAPIERCLHRRFGSLALKDCKTRLLVTALDKTIQQPFFFKSWDTRNLVLDGATELWKVCRATSAAEKYFPAFRLGNRMMWDGGNVANNPSLCAHAAAVKLWGQDERIKILSIGCGMESVKAPKWPVWIQDLCLLIGMQFATGQEEVDYIERQFLGDDYVSIQPIFTGKVALDDASEEGLAWLQSAATFFVQQNKKAFEWFLSDG